MQHPWDSQQFRAGAKAVGRSDAAIEAAIAIGNNIKRINADLPVAFTLHHLAHLCQVSAEYLQDVIHRKSDPYRTFKLAKGGKANLRPKPSRKHRWICVPEPMLMQAQRWIAQNMLNAVTPHEACHAFTPDRDLVGATKKHLRAKWLVKLDIRRFFESVPEKSVYLVFRQLGYPALLSFQLARLCTRVRREDLIGTVPRHRVRSLPIRPRVAGHLPQGAPTSPMLANLAVERLDDHLSTMAKQHGWTYTRYADDLAFSRIDDSNRGSAVMLVKLVERALIDFGFVPQSAKTRIASPGARKVLLGTLVDRERPRLTRRFRDNLETHLYALTAQRIGPTAHVGRRGFVSKIGMRRHVEGLLAFAHQVDPIYAAKQYVRFNSIDWSK